MERNGMWGRAWCDLGHVKNNGDQCSLYGVNTGISEQKKNNNPVRGYADMINITDIHPSAVN